MTKHFSKSSVLALVMMAAAGSAQAFERIVWWDFMSEGDGAHLKELIAKFNETHRGAIEIDPTTLSWGVVYYTKLQTSAAVGQGPDISTYHLSRIPSGVASKTLLPIDVKELQSIGLVDSNYPAPAIAAATIDGKRYAVPFDTHALVLYYNKTILRSLGLLGEDGKPKGIETLDGWRAALEKAKAAGKGGVGFEANKADVRLVYTLFGQMGGQLATDDKFLQGDNFDKMVKAFDEVRNWVAKGWASRNMDYTNEVADFRSGGLAFMINGDWELPTMADAAAKNKGFEFGMMVMPTWYAKAASWADSHAFVIPNNVGKPALATKHAAVLEVIKWMNENSLNWAQVGHIPAYLPVRDSAAYKALKPQSDYASVINNAFYEPKSVATGADGLFEHAWQGAMADAMNGSGVTKDALSDLRDTLNGS